MYTSLQAAMHVCYENIEHNILRMLNIRNIYFNALPALGLLTARLFDYTIYSCQTLNQ
jgi:hypothetical protein